MRIRFATAGQWLVFVVGVVLVLAVLAALVLAGNAVTAWKLHTFGVPGVAVGAAASLANLYFGWTRGPAFLRWVFAGTPVAEHGPEGQAALAETAVLARTRGIGMPTVLLAGRSGPLAGMRSGERSSEVVNGCASARAGRGVIVLTPAALALPPEQRRALIAHEVGHLANLDPRRLAARLALGVFAIAATRVSILASQGTGWASSWATTAATVAVSVALGMWHTRLRRTCESAADDFAAAAEPTGTLLLLARLWEQHPDAARVTGRFDSHPALPERIRAVARPLNRANPDALGRAFLGMTEAQYRTRRVIEEVCWADRAAFPAPVA